MGLMILLNIIHNTYAYEVHQNKYKCLYGTKLVLQRKVFYMTLLFKYARICVCTSTPMCMCERLRVSS